MLHPMSEAKNIPITCPWPSSWYKRQ